MKKIKIRETWGHCSHCGFFGSPARAPLDGEQAACMEPALGKLQLRVVGTCGCSRFQLRPGLSRTLEEPRIGPG
jgi:hypothetical protein